VESRRDPNIQAEMVGDMIKTRTDKYTGVNYNLRDDFSERTYDRLIAHLVWKGRVRRKAMWRAREDHRG
jgi:hypothetical protein